MTKEDIVIRIRDASDTLNKKLSAEVVNKLLAIMKQTLRDGEEIKISSFGKFYVQRRK
ncbi:HU family DNA-binding protein, partial [candidate division CSSED10-310 bacterium]